MNLLPHPLDSVHAYVEHFSREPLPVLRHTVRELEALRANLDRVSSKQITRVVLGDPLMTMRLLTHVERHRRQSQNHDITTIERAIMMLGVEPFFSIFHDMPTVEGVLRAHPRALVGVLKVIARARRAADLARDWAIARHDLDVQEITVAALLREAAEILCWLHAPGLTGQVVALQDADRSLRSADTQRRVFGVTAAEIQLGLIRAWHLPLLLVELLDESLRDTPRVRTIQLAAAFSRHVARGWDDPALPDDIAAIEALLHIGREALLQRLDVPEDFRARFLPEPAAE